eukprot:XP_001700052.1 predicted protein [Chlamydomonas reinhardtii]
MSIDAMEEVARARQRGQRVIGEPVASGLALDESPVWDSNFTRAAAFVMSPPLRSAEHAPALRKGLDVPGWATALLRWCTVSVCHKYVSPDVALPLPLPFPPIAGLSSPSEYVRMTSTAAAQIFNIYPRKGRLAAGSDADVIILDPRVKHRLGVGASHSPRMDTNVYEGKEVQGRVVTTISRGRLVWHEGVLDVAEGSGRYVPLPAFGPLFEVGAARGRS